MFECKIPLFNPAPLSREILLSMRDLALSEQTARYGGYSDGILYGCELVEQSMHIGVRPGLLKYGGRLYILSTPNRVAYTPTDSWAVLKIRFGDEGKSRDFLRYTGQLVIDENTECLQNELELGRFKLKRGSCLRTEYVDFEDMSTEYDTVNLIHVPYAGQGEATLSPIILAAFGREALPYAEAPLDVAFCGACLWQNGVMSREGICRYLWKRLGLRPLALNNEEIHQYLTEILRELSGENRNLSRQEDTDGILLM